MQLVMVRILHIDRCIYPPNKGLVQHITNWTKQNDVVYTLQIEAWHNDQALIELDGLVVYTLQIEAWHNDGKIF